MKSKLEKRALSPRSQRFPTKCMDVTATDNISDELVTAEKEKLLSLCRARELGEPQCQVVRVFSGASNPHFISTVQVGYKKVGSYPTLCTTANGAKLRAFRTALIEFAKSRAQKVPPNRSASSAQNGIKENALKISGMPAAGMDPYSEEYATEQNDSYPGMEIYKGQSEDANVPDICGGAEYDPNEMTEAELYGDEPSADKSANATSQEVLYGQVYGVADGTGGGEYYDPTEYSAEDQSLYANVSEFDPDQQYAEYTAEQLAGYSAEQLAELGYTVEQLAELGYTAEQLADYSTEQLAGYTAEGMAEYAEQQYAEYAAEQLAEYAVEQGTEYAEGQCAENSTEQYGECSQEYAEYSEEQYAQYAQAALEQGLDPAGDPAQYYADTSAQEFQEDHSGVYEVTEASAEQSQAEIQEYAEATADSDSAVQYDEEAYALQAFSEREQAALYASGDVALQQVDPAAQYYDESRGTAASQEMYYDETGYALEGDASAEGAVSEEAPTVLDGAGAPADSTLYDVSYTGEEAVYENGATSRGGYYGTESVPDAEQKLSAHEAYYGNGATYEEGAAELAAQEAYYETGAAYVEGQAELAAQQVYYESKAAYEAGAAEYYDGAEADQGEYATGEQAQYCEGYDGTLDPSQQEYYDETYDQTALPEGVDIYQLEELPTLDASALVPNDASTPKMQDAPTPPAENSGVGYVEEELQTSPTADEIDIYQVDQVPPTADEAVAADDLTTRVAGMSLVGSSEPDTTAQVSPVDDIDIYQVDQVPALTPDAETDGDGTTPVKDDELGPSEEYAIEEHDGPALTGSLETQLKRALIVNISFDGHVTLNLYGPSFDVFSSLVYKHKPEAVTECVLGGWYAVNLDGDENNTKRAIAQAVLDDGNSYMMWFSDEDFMSSVPMTSIFEIENVDEVYNIPSQGVTVNVMGLTEKKVSPHTVEILLSQWLYKDVYVIPVDLTGAVPKVRLINSAGDLLDV